MEVLHNEEKVKYFHLHHHREKYVTQTMNISIDTLYTDCFWCLYHLQAKFTNCYIQMLVLSTMWDRSIEDLYIKDE